MSPYVHIYTRIHIKALTQTGYPHMVAEWSRLAKSPATKTDVIVRVTKSLATILTLRT